MAEIKPETLNARLENNDDLLILDIRHEDEFEDWQIPGSVNIDVFDELRDDPAAAADMLSRVPDDEEVVTVCAAGVRSATATELLQEMGYEAKTLIDGMNGWSQVHRHAPIKTDIDGSLVQVTRPGKGCLSHVLISNGQAAVFDASQSVEVYAEVIAEYGAELVGVYDTHAHADHVSGGRNLAAEHDVPYHLHPADAEDIPVTPLEDGDSFQIGTVEVSVIHTPGHSPGSVTFSIDREALLTGDTLFHNSVGRVELGVEAGLEDVDVEQNAATLYESLKRIQSQEHDPLVLPAHDPGSPDPPVTARLSEVLRNTPEIGWSKDEFVAALSTDIPDHPPNFERIKRVNVGIENASEEELTELEVGPNRCAAEI
jgi:glyoxylase-like metal-dependent hydrolase (beta-lactamase superfamily II)